MMELGDFFLFCFFAVLNGLLGGVVWVFCDSKDRALYQWYSECPDKTGVTSFLVLSAWIIPLVLVVFGVWKRNRYYYADTYSYDGEEGVDFVSDGKMLEEEMQEEMEEKAREPVPSTPPPLPPKSPSSPSANLSYAPVHPLLLVWGSSSLSEVDKDLKIRLLEDEVLILQDAIVTALDVVDSWREDVADGSFCEDDSHHAQRRVTLRKLGEAIYQRTPRLMYEKGQQSMYSLRFRELRSENLILQAEVEKLRAKVSSLRQEN
jgi:hypothetical protein